MAFKIDKVNEIPERCLDNDTHLYIKEDGTLYINKKDGSIINIGGKETEIGETHNHTNLDNLNKIGEDSEGNLTYNGNKIEAEIPVASNITVGGIKIDSPFRIGDNNTLKLVYGLGLTVNNLGQLLVNGYDYSFDPIKDTSDLPMLKTAVYKYFLEKTKFESFKTNTIGTAELSTDDKTLKGAINELFTSVSNGKNLLETAITDKGGTVSKSGYIATFDELKSGILDVPTANCKLNIFAQSTEPVTKQGLWLKTDNTYYKIEDFSNTKFDSFKYTVTDHGYDGGYGKHYTQCVKVGKYAYLIGGERATSRNLRYDLETNQTATMTSIPSDFQDYSGYRLNFCCSDGLNKIFLIQSGSNHNKHAQYNINTNTYTTLNLPDVSFKSYTRGGACYYKNNIYCFSTTGSSYNFIYNLNTNTVTNIQISGSDNIILIEDNIYLFGSNNSGSCYKYNITTGTVTTLATSLVKTNSYITVYNHGNYIYQCTSSDYIGESPAKLAIVRYDIVNNKHERIMEITTPSSAPAGSHYCGVIYNNKLLLFDSSMTYNINFILNKNCLYIDKSDNTNNALLVETPYELLNKKETFKSCFLTNNNSESISCNTYIGNGTSWNKI